MAQYEILNPEVSKVRQFSVANSFGIGELKHEVRGGEEDARMNNMLARFEYARKLIGIDANLGLTEQIDQINNRITTKAQELRKMARNGAIKDPDAKGAAVAVADYIYKTPKTSRWELVTLSLNEANLGLTVSPDLVRRLIVGYDPELEFAEYKEMVRKFEQLAPTSFKATVISYINKNGRPERGPEYIVPMIESDIDWRTGENKGMYMFYLYRYRKDTSFINTNPEYEPVGFYLKETEKDKWETTRFISRAHWVPYSIPIDLVERTESGAVKLTTLSDTPHSIKGHGIGPVMKDREAGVGLVLGLNPQLKGLGIDGIIRSAIIEDIIKNASEYYDNGKTYDVPTRLIMVKTPKNDPFQKPIR